MEVINSSCIQAEKSYNIFKFTKHDDLVKSLKTVTPAEAGVQNSLNLLDSRFRGNDKNGEIATFYETNKHDRRK
ncbi:MAG: hypothetical protein QME90_11360 [Thermodesulfobacteriota bacterium]|nr:hypothetical protein [Thermodesulfobacteriota bacterium]